MSSAKLFVCQLLRTGYVFVLILPVTTKLPVISALPVYGNPADPVLLDPVSWICPFIP
jgi:hypothetical protein